MNEAEGTPSTQPYQEYRAIRSQIEQFQKHAAHGHRIAITLPDFPFFTETALQTLFIYESGAVVISGRTKGNKQMSIRTRVESLTFALSLVSNSDRYGSPELLEIGFVAGN